MDKKTVDTLHAAEEALRTTRHLLTTTLVQLLGIDPLPPHSPAARAIKEAQDAEKKIRDLLISDAVKGTP